MDNELNEILDSRRLTTIYIPFRFYEREPEDIQIICMFFPEQIDKGTLQSRLTELLQCYQNGNEDPEAIDSYDSPEEMTDDLFSSLAEEFKGVWEYCDCLKPLIVGE